MANIESPNHASFKKTMSDAMKHDLQRLRILHQGLTMTVIAVLILSFSDMVNIPLYRSLLKDLKEQTADDEKLLRKCIYNTVCSALYIFGAIIA